MQKKLFPMTILAALILTVAIAQDSQPPQPVLPAGMAGGFETAQSKVIKVYSAEEDGARFRAYVVNWKDNEVIVTDVLGRTHKKVGDTITFMANRIEMPQGEEDIKLLQFMIMEFPGMPTED